MRDVAVDPGARLAHVGPGCLLHDVDDDPGARAPTVLGFVSETGVAGLTLGGGFGYLARRSAGQWTTSRRSRSSPPTARSAERRDEATISSGPFAAVEELWCRDAVHVPAARGRPFRRRGSQDLGGGQDLRRARCVPRAHGVGSARVDGCSSRADRPAGPFVPPVAWPSDGRRAPLLQRLAPRGRSGAASRARRAHRRPVAERAYVEQQSLLDAMEPKGSTSTGRPSTSPASRSSTSTYSVRRSRRRRRSRTPSSFTPAGL